MKRGGLGVRSKRCFITSRHFTPRCHANSIRPSFSFKSVSPHPSPQKFGVSLIHFGQSFRPNFRGEGCVYRRTAERRRKRERRKRERSEGSGRGSERGLAKANHYKPNYFATKLTIRSGTAISFKIVFPSNNSAIFGSAFASVNNSSLFVPRATTILDRNLPII